MQTTLTKPNASPAVTTLLLHFPRLSRSKSAIAQRILNDAIDRLIAEDGLERIADAVTDLKISL